MLNDTHISVVIVTKNRADDLIHCLGSLTAQSVHPDEIIVIDNGSIDDTRIVVKRHAKSVHYPVRYVVELKKGYPAIYNRGLHEAKYRWVVFIDDDCVAITTWAQSIKSAIKKHPSAAVILGHTEPYHPLNVFSLATHIFHEDWRMKHMKGNRIISYEILDNKNIAYNNSFLVSQTLRYSEERIKHFRGAAEDCDLGIKIQNARGVAMYEPEMLAYHKEPETAGVYIRKYFLSLGAYEWFRQACACMPTPQSSHIRFRSLAVGTAKKYSYSTNQKFMLFCVLYPTVIVSIILDMLVRIPGMRMRIIKKIEHIFTT